MYKGMNFGGMGGMNMQALMKQAQKMQQNLAEADEKLETSEVVGTSGGGMVSVTATGKKKIVKISIKPDIVDPDDVEMLEDLVLTAVNDAMLKADELDKSLKGDMPIGL